MKALYKYPQTNFPYLELREENSRRNNQDPEYEIDDTGNLQRLVKMFLSIKVKTSRNFCNLLADTGVFENGYWDVLVEYAKESPNSMAIKISLTNVGSSKATIHIIPTVW